MLLMAGCHGAHKRVLCSICFPRHKGQVILVSISIYWSRNLPISDGQAYENGFHCKPGWASYGADLLAGSEGVVALINEHGVSFATLQLSLLAAFL